MRCFGAGWRFKGGEIRDEAALVLIRRLGFVRLVHIGTTL